MDAESLQLGDDWDREIALAQRVSLVTVVLVSAQSAEAYYQREEVAAAIKMARENPATHRVVPIFLSTADKEAADVYGLRLKHGITLGDDLTLDDAAEQLRELLGNLRRRQSAVGAGATAAADFRGVLHAPAAGWVAPLAANRWRYKVVAFDLDGTLLRGDGFEFSWSRIWSALNVSKKVQNDLRREYRRKAEADPSPRARIAAYRKWCDEAVAHFKRRGLTRQQMREISAPLHLTVQCRETLRTLRENGVVTAIISGGIDTFLEDCFPDFRDHVDFAFINRLLFTAEGTLDRVLPTAYDFEGKADALDFVCEKAGCSSEETAFIGDHFNDEAIMLRAKLSIAYPPQDTVSAGVATESIRVDDLSTILPYIFVE